LIEQRNYSHLTTYVFKADAAIDATASTAPGSTTSAPTPTATAGSKKKSVERDNVQAKLDLATALSNLGQGSYEKAAQYFLKVGSPKDLGDWVGKVCFFFNSCTVSLLCTLNIPLSVDSSLRLVILRSMAPSPRLQPSPDRLSKPGS
jgi:COP9 signalosome complex subunit 1